MCKKSKTIVFEKAALNNALNKSQLFCVKDLNNVNLDKVLCHARQVDDDYFVYLLNTDRENCISNIAVHAALGGYFVEEWNLRDTSINLLTHNEKEKSTMVDINLALGGEIMLRFTKNTYASSLAKTEIVEESINLKEPLEYSLNEDNICVLDYVDYFINNEFKGRNEVLLADRAIRQELKIPVRSGDMLQPWFINKYFPETAGKEMATVVLNYDFDVEVLPKNISIVLENPENFEIYLNGNKVEKNITGTIIDNCFFKILLEENCFVLGKNILSLTTKFKNSTNIECIYLVGKFGVKLNNLQKILTTLPEKLKLEDTNNQGLPFYSGSITYKTGITGKKLRVKLDEIDCALIKVGDNKQVIAFSPYEATTKSAKGLEIEVVLTRRNTFGPLHMPFNKHDCYGPESFIAERKFTPYYSILPQGLKGNILVEKLK